MDNAQGVTRRGVLAGAAAIGVVGTVAACGSPGSNTPQGGSGPVTVSAAQVPVGSAVIVGQAVVSQPTAGQFKAFSAICTHEGCLVSRVQSDKIICMCHSSVFSAKDGSVIDGPARRALDPRTVSQSGDTLTVS
jgi:Rieske Fe-S protein